MRYNTTQTGFSLVETLVAITILLFVIIGPLKISTQTSRSSSFSNEQVTAFFLAQEGLELAERARDDLLLAHFAGANADPWNDIKNSGGTYRNCYGTDGCRLEIGPTATGLLLTTTACTDDFVTGINACQLYYDDFDLNQRTYFTHSRNVGSNVNTTSPYIRKIFFQGVGNDQIRVVSEVTWRTGFLRDEQKVSVESTLFNIYGTP